MFGQLVDNVLAGAGVIHQADESGAHIGNILGHIAADAAVDLLDPAGVAPARDVGGQRIAFNIHKHRTDDYDTHTKKSFPIPKDCPYCTMVRQDAQLCYNFFNFSSRFSASCSVPSFFAKWKRIK